MPTTIQERCRRCGAYGHDASRCGCNVYSALNPAGERVLLPVGQCFGRDGEIAPALTAEQVAAVDEMAAWGCHV